jgi:hypothetical protein
MITKRDKQMLEYLLNYKCAHTSTLAMFYPSLQITRRRLKTLYESHEIGRVRDNINAEYVYYLTKPKQLRHSVLLTDFLREFSRVATIESCKTEVTVGNVRSDALIGYKRKDKRYLAFVEVQISNTALDVQKYEKLYYSKEWEKKRFPQFPVIIAITDKKIPDTSLKIIRINEDLSNLKEG